MKKILFLFLMLCYVVTVKGQGPCGGKTISDANDYYDIGLFEESVKTLMPCLTDGGLTEDQMVKAYHLMVLNYVALDDLDQARQYMDKLIGIVPEFIPDLDDPKPVWDLTDEVKNGLHKDYVFSLTSARDEVLKLPAHVMIIEDTQIEERGYTDFTQIFRDVPGFDFTYYGGSVYGGLSNRGYRSGGSEGILFLIDGVEQNDPHTGRAGWVPSIPLDGIDRVEFVYGPSVALFGRKAYAGVVNVITKDLEEGKKLLINASGGYGGTGQAFGELFFKARTKSVEVKVSGKYFRSDLRDLSRDSSFQYSPIFYEDFDYASKMTLTGNDAKIFATRYKDILNNINLDVERNDMGEVISIAPSLLGQSNARQRDLHALDTIIGGDRLGYKNSLESYYLDVSVKLSDIELGYRGVFNDMGNMNDGTSLSLAGRDNGASWQPRQSMLYSLFSRDLFGKLLVKNVSYFKMNEVPEKSAYTSFSSYANGTLKLNDLATSVRSAWSTDYYFQNSKEFFERLSVQYRLSETIQLYGGGEFRGGTIQGDYLKDTDGTPSKNGSAYGAKNNDYDYLAFGAFLSGELEFSSLLRLSASARWDNDDIRGVDPFGDLWSYQIGLIVKPGPAIIKLIASQAYQTPSFAELYSTDFARKRNNPKLEAQMARNYELDISLIPSGNFNMGVTGYYTKYEKFIGEQWKKEGLDEFYQFNNLGDVDVYGVMFSLNYRVKNWSVYANYAFAKSELKPKDGEKVDVGALAESVGNLGVNMLFFKKLNFNVNANYISEIKVGEGTSSYYNPYGEFPSVVKLNAAVTFNEVVPGLTLQVSGENLLNENYNSPGMLSADGVLRSSYIPQAKASIFGKVIYRLSK
ncbi:hypothetical protein FUAX_14640 [Fulvitalea axinellae]|uniref:TonB-dependent receptor plug domain-containing protein n=1 Tax=Fulvitalea axinellae TaxID=1182444 RepID=A0AAU9CQ09_9BACT|nr:hypothetical protein FUAX_14640 [Fulvitalea axinellae]